MASKMTWRGTPFSLDTASATNRISLFIARLASTLTRATGPLAFYCRSAVVRLFNPPPYPWRPVPLRRSETRHQIGFLYPLQRQHIFVLAHGQHDFIAFHRAQFTV